MRVIDRLCERLKIEKKIRGYKVARYLDLPDGTKEFTGYVRQHFELPASDMIELVAMCPPTDEIVQAQLQGAKFSLSCSPENTVIVHADDVFHLIELATTKKERDPWPPASE